MTRTTRAHQRHISMRSVMSARTLADTWCKKKNARLRTRVLSSFLVFLLSFLFPFFFRAARRRTHSSEAPIGGNTSTAEQQAPVRYHGERNRTRGTGRYLEGKDTLGGPHSFACPIKEDGGVLTDMLLSEPRTRVRRLTRAPPCQRQRWPIHGPPSGQSTVNPVDRGLASVAADRVVHE